MSRSLDDLIPSVRVKAELFLQKCKQAGLDVLITDTRRTFQEQAELWAQGRTKPGPRVTNAKPGYSWHNFGRAFDIVPLLNGRPNWKAPHDVWLKLGEIGESVQLEWGGRWTVEVEGIVDLPHFEDRSGMTLAEAREKEMPSEFRNV